MSQSTVFCQRLKESGLKCTATNQDIKSDTVIKNTDTVFCMWRNDADIAGMQSSCVNSLDCGMGLVRHKYADDLEKLMLMNRISGVYR